MKNDIPNTLDEAVDQILTLMTQEQKDAYAREPADRAGAAQHHGLGTAIRNDWGLWFGETPISAFLKANRIVHGDDQSAVIFRAVWNRLNGFSTNLETEAAYYEKHWNRHGLTWDLQPLSGYVEPKRGWTFKIDKNGKIVEETRNDQSANE